MNDLTYTLKSSYLSCIRLLRFILSSGSFLSPKLCQLIYVFFFVHFFFTADVVFIQFHFLCHLSGFSFSRSRFFGFSLSISFLFFRHIFRLFDKYYCHASPITHWLRFHSLIVVSHSFAHFVLILFLFVSEWECMLILHLLRNIKIPHSCSRLL